jgi:hypothetical protein
LNIIFIMFTVLKRHKITDSLQNGYSLFLTMNSNIFLVLLNLSKIRGNWRKFYWTKAWVNWNLLWNPEHESVVYIEKISFQFCINKPQLKRVMQIENRVIESMRTQNSILATRLCNRKVLPKLSYVKTPQSDKNY